MPPQVVTDVGKQQQIAVRTGLPGWSTVCGLNTGAMAANPARKWWSRSSPTVASHTRGDAQHNPLMQGSRRDGGFANSVGASARLDSST